MLLRSAGTAARPARTRLAWGTAVLGSALLSLSLATPAFGANVAADQAVLGEQALALSDLPTGWAITNTSGGGGAASGCPGKPFGTTHRIAKVEADFQAQSGLPLLFEQIALYSSAASVFQRGVRAINRCRLVSIKDGATKIKIHVAKLSFPGGRRIAAYSLRFSINGEAVGIDVVVEEVGNEIVQIGLANVPSPQLVQVEQFVTEAVQKVEKTPPAPG
jgi:hypothetical protein